MVQEHGRKHDLPVSASERPEGVSLGTLPVVELTDQIYLGGIRRPLAEHPVALCITVKSVIYMVVHSLAQGAVHRQPVLEGKNHFVTSVYDILVGLEPFVGIIDHLCLLCTHIDTILLYGFTGSTEVCATCLQQLLRTLHIFVNIIYTRLRVLHFCGDRLKLLYRLCIVKFLSHISYIRSSRRPPGSSG